MRPPWAAWRSLLQRPPLIDVWVAGGGDVANCFAALGVPEAVIQRHQLTPAHAAYYLPRARALAQALGGRVGHVPGTIRALWHGDLNQRGYRDRHGRVAQHGFDPARFLQLAPSGVWAWTDIAADLADDLREHFIRRNEDGLLPPPPPLPPAAG